MTDLGLSGTRNESFSWVLVCDLPKSLSLTKLNQPNFEKKFLIIDIACFWGHLFKYSPCELGSSTLGPEKGE